MVSFNYYYRRDQKFTELTKEILKAWPKHLIYCCNLRDWNQTVQGSLLSHPSAKGRDVNSRKPTMAPTYITEKKESGIATSLISNVPWPKDIMAITRYWAKLKPWTGFVGRLAHISGTEEDHKENIQCSKFFITAWLSFVCGFWQFWGVEGDTREKQEAAELRHLWLWSL